jgi:tetratricopeptide (TPR) repeat protein
MLDFALSEILDDPTSTLECLSSSQKEAYLFTLFHELKLELERGCGEEERVARGVLFLLLLSPHSPDLFLEGVNLLYTQGIKSKQVFWFSYSVDAISILSIEKRTPKLHALLVTSLYMCSVLQDDPASAYEALNQDNRSFESVELSWILAKCWCFIGRFSGEQSDFIKGISALRSLQKEVQPSMTHSLVLDLSLALIDLGRVQGDLKALEEADTLLKPITAHYSQHEQGRKETTSKAWHLLIEGAMEAYRLVGSSETFKKAESYIKEALLFLPEEKSFWLDAGELYLNQSFWNESLSDVETALEKLSAEGLRPHYENQLFQLCCPGLALMGLYSNNYSMIRTALDQISVVLEETYTPGRYRTFLWVLWAQAFSLNDPVKFEEVERKILSWMDEHGEDPRELFMLYKIYAKEDLSSAHSILKRLVKRCPQHVIYRSHLGKLLHKVRASATRDEDHQALLEEAAFQFECACRGGGGYEPLVCLGTTYDQLGLILKEEIFFARALETFEAAFDMEHPDFESLFLFGRMLVHHGDVCELKQPLDRGINLLRQLCELDPERSQDLQTLLGYSLLLKKTREEEGSPDLLVEAEKWLSLAFSKGKKEACYLLTCVHAQRKKFRKALRFALKSLETGVIPSLEVLVDDPWAAPFVDSPWFSWGVSLID